jgi:hypothetical protein
MDRVATAILIAATLAIAACATTSSNDNYVICNDLDVNVTCPDTTANVVVAM